MKLITTDTYTFSDLIEGGFVYVDKTDRIRELLRPPMAQYFMARPRLARQSRDGRVIWNP